VTHACIDTLINWREIWGFRPHTMGQRHKTVLWNERSDDENGLEWQLLMETSSKRMDRTGVGCANNERCYQNLHITRAEHPYICCLLPAAFCHVNCFSRLCHFTEVGCVSRMEHISQHIHRFGGVSFHAISCTGTDDRIRNNEEKINVKTTNDKINWPHLVKNILVHTQRKPELKYVVMPIMMATWWLGWNSSHIFRQSEVHQIKCAHAGEIIVCNDILFRSRDTPDQVAKVLMFSAPNYLGEGCPNFWPNCSNLGHHRTCG